MPTGLVRTISKGCSWLGLYDSETKTCYINEFWLPRDRAVYNKILAHETYHHAQFEAGWAQDVGSDFLWKGKKEEPENPQGEWEVQAREFEAEWLRVWLGGSRNVLWKVTP